MQEFNFEPTISFIFSQISGAFRVALDKKLQSINLNGGQFFVLIELWKQDGLSQIELAQKLNVAPPTVHKMIKSLSERGFVNCIRCSVDNRLMRVFLTETAHTIQSEAVKCWEDFELNTFAPLNETEKLICFQLLEKLKTSLI